MRYGRFIQKRRGGWEQREGLAVKAVGSGGLVVVVGVGVQAVSGLQVRFGFMCSHSISANKHPPTQFLSLPFISHDSTNGQINVYSIRV